MIKFATKNSLMLLTLAGSMNLAGCNNPEVITETNATTENIQPATEITKEPFGTTPDGQEVSLYTLTNGTGVVVKITNFGAIVTSVITPDKNDRMGDVVLGFNNVKGYIPNDPHIGGIIGRYANRIAKGRFTVEDQEYKLATNNGDHHLHGGNIGFDRVVWQAETLPDQNAIRLTYVSKDQEEGYPGNLTATVTYTLTPENGLRIDYTATTDKATPVNLTNHSYFDLSAGQEKNILNNIVQINAESYTVPDKDLIPTGELAPVHGTPLDFTTPEPIGTRIDNLQGYGYDLNYVINNGGEDLVHAATVYEPTTGRVMEVHTTQPGLQLYTAYHLDGSLKGKDNRPYTRYAGLCLEAQHFPDSPNKPNFPSTLLKPGDTYRETTIYKFAVRR